MNKLGQERSALDMMSLYVVFLRALYQVHQQNHWEAQDYGQHLLFERIYEGIKEMADEAAEKTIGLFGDLTKQEKISSIASQFAHSKFKREGKMKYAASSLRAEIAFQKYATYVYKTLKESEDFTLGLESLIADQISKSEVHSYLLKQILKTDQTL
jgi:DNA-binding ferritin-like protein